MGGPVGGAGAVGAGIGSRKLATAATLLVMLAFVLYSCVCGPSACYSTIVSKNGEREGEVLHSANGGAAALVPATVITGVMCHPAAGWTHGTLLVAFIVAAWAALRRAGVVPDRADRGNDGGTGGVGGGSGGGGDGGGLLAWLDSCDAVPGRNMVEVRAHAAARLRQLACACGALVAHCLMLAMFASGAAAVGRSIALLPLVMSQALLQLAAAMPPPTPTLLSRVITVATTCHLLLFPAAAVRSVTILVGHLPPAEGAGALPLTAAILLIATFASMVVHAAHAAAASGALIAPALVATFFAATMLSSAGAVPAVAFVAGGGLLATAAAVGGILWWFAAASRGSSSSGPSPSPRSYASGLLHSSSSTPATAPYLSAPHYASSVL